MKCIEFSDDKNAFYIQGCYGTELVDVYIKSKLMMDRITAGYGIKADNA